MFTWTQAVLSAQSRTFHTIVAASLALVIPVWAAAGVDDDLNLNVRPCTHFDKAVTLGVASDGEFVTLAGGETGLFERRGLFQSPVIDTGDEFDRLLFSFSADLPPGTGAEFQVRIVRNGQAGRWYRIDREGEAVFEARARSFQYRFILSTTDGRRTPAVDDLSFVFELSSPSSPETNRSVVRRFRERAAASGEPTTSTPQVHPVPAPEITTRGQWGARKPSDPYVVHKPVILIVHHTYSPTTADYAGAATIRGIQKYHMDVRHWKDIGYHFIIGPEGRIYEGRPPTVVGAHCIPNTGKVGISVVGNYMKEKISPEARKSLVHLLAWLADSYDIPESSIYGHKDFMSTLCPGDDIYGQLQSIRDDVAAMRAGGHR